MKTPPQTPPAHTKEVTLTMPLRLMDAGTLPFFYEQLGSIGDIKVAIHHAHACLYFFVPCDAQQSRTGARVVVVETIALVEALGPHVAQLAKEG